jgi:hypothetical protein
MSFKRYFPPAIGLYSIDNVISFFQKMGHSLL